MIPIILLNAAMGAVVWLAGFLPLADIPRLILQIITGIAVYIGLSRLFRNRQL